MIKNEKSQDRNKPEIALYRTIGRQNMLYKRILNIFA